MYCFEPLGGIRRLITNSGGRLQSEREMRTVQKEKKILGRIYTGSFFFLFLNCLTLMDTMSMPSALNRE